MENFLEMISNGNFSEAEIGIAIREIPKDFLEKNLAYLLSSQHSKNQAVCELSRKCFLRAIEDLPVENCLSILNELEECLRSSDKKVVKLSVGKTLVILKKLKTKDLVPQLKYLMECQGLDDQDLRGQSRDLIYRIFKDEFQNLVNRLDYILDCKKSTNTEIALFADELSNKILRENDKQGLSRSDNDKVYYFVVYSKSDMDLLLVKTYFEIDLAKTTDDLITKIENVIYSLTVREVINVSWCLVTTLRKEESLDHINDLVKTGQIPNKQETTDYLRKLVLRIDLDKLILKVGQSFSLKYYSVQMGRPNFMKVSIDPLKRNSINQTADTGSHSRNQIIREVEKVVQDFVATIKKQNIRASNIKKIRKIIVS